MSIHSLRERILIQTRAYQPDRLGGYRVTWADRGEIWASVKALPGDTEQLDETKGLAPARYLLRWRVGTKVPATARLLWREMPMRFLSQPKEDVYRRFMSAVVMVEASHE